ncbi:MAG: hypothetical protein HKM95_17680 [Inquilinus sp.]|nr:hypothetical protein [Inquilinus sp.]
MSRPAAALTSDLLVRKGAALPLGYGAAPEPRLESDWPVRDGVVDPAPAWTAPPEPTEAEPIIGRRHGRWRLPLSRRVRQWRLAGRRWSLPTALLLGGLAMILVVATLGPEPALVPSGTTSLVASRPPGPTPVTWVDLGLRGRVADVAEALRAGTQDAGRP